MWSVCAPVIAPSSRPTRSSSCNASLPICSSASGWSALSANNCVASSISRHCSLDSRSRIAVAAPRIPNRQDAMPEVRSAPRVSDVASACWNARGASTAFGASAATSPVSRHNVSISSMRGAVDVVLAAQALQRRTREAHQIGRALGVAAEPEQVLGRPARDRARPPDQIVGAEARLQQRRRIDDAVGHHPGIDGAAAARHRRVEQRVARADPRQAARQHPPALRAVGQCEHAQQQRLRHDARAAVTVGRAVPRPGRRLRQRQIGLYRSARVRQNPRATRPAAPT
jgi:hypothetical protein